MNPLLCALLIVLALATSPVAAQQQEMFSEVDRTHLYLGESIRYQVLLNHVKEPAPPTMIGFDDFDVRLLGERSLNQRHEIIRNGRRRVVIQVGQLYVYELTPRKAGRLTVPSPVAEVNGKPLTGPIHTLIVTAPEKQDVALIAITSEPAAVYPSQVFTVTLTVALKELPGQLSDRNPAGVRIRRDPPPTLAIPWVLEQQIPDGAEPLIGPQEWLGPLRNRRGWGFKINNVGSNSVMSFFRDEAVTFMPPPRNTRRQTLAGEMTGYWEFKFSRQFRAGKPGAYHFGPVTLKGRFISDITLEERISARDIYAVAKPITVTVKDVPRQGRPDSYIGAVGTFHIASRLKPTRVKVGDPMTLTLILSGTGNLDSVVPPDLSRLDAVTADFKIYEATQQPHSEGRVFTYSLRPLREGIDRFPAVPISHFDVKAERFVTQQTEPIDMDVTEAVALNADDIAVGRSPGTAGTDVEARQEGIFANVTEVSALRNQRIAPRRWLAGLGGVVGLYFLVAVGFGQLQRYSGNKDRQRRRAAPGRARRRLREAGSQIDRGDHREAAEHLGAALVGLVADLTAQGEVGLATGDATRRLKERGLDPALVDRFGRLLESCDAARFGASADNLHGLGDEAARLIDELAAAIKKTSR